MSIDLNKWVVACDDHYKIFEEYIDDVNLKIYVHTKPTAQPARATQFDSKEEAEQAIKSISNTKIEPICLYKPIQLQEINDREAKRIDEESDAIMRNAWSNTSEERKKEMLDEIRKNGGDQAVEDWLNKYERSINND